MSSTLSKILDEQETIKNIHKASKNSNMTLKHNARFKKVTSKQKLLKEINYNEFSLCVVVNKKQTSIIITNNNLMFWFYYISFGNYDSNRTGYFKQDLGKCILANSSYYITSDLIVCKEKQPNYSFEYTLTRIFKRTYNIYKHNLKEVRQRNIHKIEQELSKGDNCDFGYVKKIANRQQRLPVQEEKQQELLLAIIRGCIFSVLKDDIFEKRRYVNANDIRLHRDLIARNLKRYSYEYLIRLICLEVVKKDKIEWVMN